MPAPVGHDNLLEATIIPGLTALPDAKSPQVEFTLAGSLRDERVPEDT